MTRRPRIVLLALCMIIGIVLIPIALIGTWLLWRTIQIERFERNTPLAREPALKWRVARGHFRDRVHSAFPSGTPVADIARTLAEQGFTSRDGLRVDLGHGATDAEGEHLARLAPALIMVAPDPRGFVCNTNWVIGWEADAQNRATVVLADLSGACL